MWQVNLRFLCILVTYQDVNIWVDKVIINTINNIVNIYCLRMLHAWCNSMKHDATPLKVSILSCKETFATRTSRRISCNVLSKSEYCTVILLCDVSGVTAWAPLAAGPPPWPPLTATPWCNTQAAPGFSVTIEEWQLSS